MGRKITTAANMIASVSRLEDASHTVKLSLGSLDDGIRKGNSATPAVAIVPNGTKADAIKARPGRARSKTAPNAPR